VKLREAFLDHINFSLSGVLPAAGPVGETSGLRSDTGAKKSAGKMSGMGVQRRAEDFRCRRQSGFQKGRLSFSTYCENSRNGCSGVCNKDASQDVASPWMMVDASNFFGRMRSTPKSSLVDVTQPLVSSIHQLIDGVLVHNAVRRDRRRELQEFSLAEEKKKKLVDQPRTFM